MIVCQNCGATNEEGRATCVKCGNPLGGPIDGLAALRRLASVGAPASEPPRRDRPMQTGELGEAVPDWLELLLAKYGQEASTLVGAESHISAPSGPSPSVSSPETASRLASLLERMGTEAPPAPDQLVTSVDWGKPVASEAAEEEADWLDTLVSKSSPAEPAPTQPPASQAAGITGRVEEPSGAEETPDWLAGLSTSAQPTEPSPPPGPEAPAGEVPDWLRELDATTSRPEPSPEETAPAVTGVTDWLTGLGEEAPTTQPAAPEEGGAVPDWVRDLGEISPPAAPPPPAPVAAPPPPLSATPGAEAEVPDWLSRLAKAPAPTGKAAGLGGVPPVEQEKPSARETGPAAEPGAPSWLADLGLSEAETTGLAEGGAAPEATPNVPDWLREMELAESALPPQPPRAETPGKPESELPDWLQAMEPVEAAAPPAPPETPPAKVVAETPAEAEPELPDWLRAMELPETAVPPTPPETPPAKVVAETPAEAEPELPDWLRAMELPETAVPPTPPETPPAKVEAETPAEAEPELPDWLRAMELPETAVPPALPETSPAEVVAETPAEAEPELPDWLATLRSEEYLAGGEDLGLPSPEEAAEEAPEEQAEEPDWLAQLRAAREEEAMELKTKPEVVEADEGELPDWLAEVSASRETPQPPPPEIEFIPQTPRAEVEPEKAEIHPEAAAPAEAEEAGALDWLAELESIEAAEPQVEAPVSPAQPEATPAVEAGLELPDWLREEEEAAASPPAAQPPAPEEADLSWLTELGPEGAEGPHAAEEVAPAEIPDWLRELQPEERAPAEPKEGEKVLAGMPGLLPVTEEPKPPAAPSPRAAVPEVPDVEGARLFRDISAGRPAQVPPTEEEALPESRRGRVLATVVMVIAFIALVVLIALALMLVLSRVGELMKGTAFGEFFGTPVAIEESPASPINTLRAEIIKLPTDAVVVVSFDYSPATEAEMDPLADIVVRDLLSRQARVVAVSLQPEGAAMAQRLLARFEAEYPSGQRTLNLGYLPGQTVGVRNLAFLSTASLFQVERKSMGDYPAWQDVSGLGDVALIVDVADNPLAVRWWVEQVGPGTEANRPLIAAVSAAADPTVRPYYNALNPRAGQLRGLVSGVAGAAAYENRLQQPGRAMGSLAAQSVASLSMVVFSLGGTIAGLAHRTREM
jgi:hypothetical protein